MKKIYFLLISTLALCTTAQAQDKKVQFGVKSGLNLSVFSASINADSYYKTGFHLGAYVKTSIGKKASFRPEIYYSSQGQKNEYLTPPNGPVIGTTTANTNYLNVPLLLEIGNKFSFQAGPQIGFLLSAREEGEIDGETIDSDLKSIMKGTDFSVVMGVGFQPGDHLNFGARLNYGLSEIFNESGSNGFPSIQHRVFHFYLGYTF